ncbi:maleylacetate reductase [Actinoallomurus rhizosphaericola]|uniref:maleylacetate reductase n=1 Tax=Actinoallomurus rhizosphaericola TaxID=2952536 RepID=UPI0020933882|nr:maleylacetate reductase [Actinoallomurus rhizosphaericola]MCO5998975.1 maleylacetate reductase [Actinoallomurus rhizosphaericola]
MENEAFVYESWQARVVFGPGRVDSVGDETALLGAKRIFLIADRNAPGAETARRSLGTRLVGRWDEIAQHVPVELAERAGKAVESAAADCVVCLGGGSATGLGKAVVRKRPVPLVAVPTTYAGSEMTTVYGLTDGDRKVTGRDPNVRPKVVVYDPELTTGLPLAVTGPSAFNSLAHCVAALTAPDADPVTSALALEAVRHIHAGLPLVMAHPSDVEGRGRLQFGAFLAGTALAGTGTGLNHRICHVLGGLLGLPHADTHSVVLPHVVALNATALPRETARLAEALGAPGGDPAALLWDLADRNGIATDLASLGVRPEHLPVVAGRVEPRPNPRPVTADDIERLLEHALAGRRPDTA